MIRVALKGLAGRKLRAVLTALAIVLGVTMVSGTFVLTDTIDKAFNNIFQGTYAHTDAVVSGKSADINVQGDSTATPSIPQDVLAKVRALPDVAAATGSVIDDSNTKILKKNGKEVKTKGYCTDVFTDAALEFIKNKSEKPFFAYVAYNAPHGPYQVPDELAAPYRKLDLTPAGTLCTGSVDFVRDGTEPVHKVGWVGSGLGCRHELHGGGCRWHRCPGCRGCDNRNRADASCSTVPPGPANSPNTARGRRGLRS